MKPLLEDFAHLVVTEPFNDASGKPFRFVRVGAAFGAQAGELPADIVYRDAEITAFRDIHPRAPVHILIVPIKPIPTTDDIADEDESLIGHVVIVARDLARQYGVAKSGYRLILNCNPDSGQEVYHLHFHLLGSRPLGPLLPRAL